MQSNNKSCKKRHSWQYCPQQISARNQKQNENIYITNKQQISNSKTLSAPRCLGIGVLIGTTKCNITDGPMWY